MISPPFGVRMQWCFGEPEDLDMYLFMPDVEEGIFVRDMDHAVFWRSKSRQQGDGAGNGGADLTLELDDTGIDDTTGFRTFGPESMIIEGRLMPGK